MDEFSKALKMKDMVRALWQRVIDEDVRDPKGAA